MEEMNREHESHRPGVLWANMCYLLSAVMQKPAAHIVAAVFALAAANADIGVVSNTATAVYQVLLLGLPGVWYVVRHREALPSLRLNPPAFGLMAGAAALAFAGALLANNLGTWWMLLIDKMGGTLYQSGIEIPTNTEMLTKSILLIGVLPGICEELFFRGMMMSAWERHGKRRALIVSGVLFGLLHGSLLGFPVQLLMGLVLGYLVLMSDSLYVGMMYHTMYNTSTLLLAYWSSQSGASADPMMYENLSGYVAEYIGYIPLLSSTIMTAGIFTGILMLMKRGRSVELTTRRRPLGRQEWVLLIAALAAVVMMWFEDLARVW